VLRASKPIIMLSLMPAQSVSIQPKGSIDPGFDFCTTSVWMKLFNNIEALVKEEQWNTAWYITSGAG
jgi:hypothetical protein